MTNAGVNGFPAGTPAPASGPRQVFVSALGTAKSTVGTWSILQNSAAYLGSYFQNSTGTAQNDSIAFYEVWLDAGTWQLDLIGHQGTDGAQVSVSLVSLNGVTVSYSGTQEQYAASAAPTRTNFTGVQVSTAGLYSVKCLATSKNASSSSYRTRISGAILTRTA